MGKSATTAAFVLTLSTLMVLAALGLCASHEARSALTLADLDRAHQTLMSCDVPSESAEPMWCADPSDPQCLPAVPAQRHADPLNGAPPAIHTAAWTMPAPPRGRLLLGWSRPEASRAPPQARLGRLERPPRA